MQTSEQMMEIARISQGKKGGKGKKGERENAGEDGDVGDAGEATFQVPDVQNADARQPAQNPMRLSVSSLSASRSFSSRIRQWL